MYEVYGSQPTTIVIVDQKQGPQGDLTPEVLAAKEAAEKAAADSEQSAKESADSAANAKNSAEDAAKSAALAFGATAPAYDPNKAYTYGEEPYIVAYTDGSLYMCLGENIIGEPPDTSPNWKKLTVSIEGFFYLDEHNYLVPSPVVFDSEIFRLDEKNYITFKEVP